MFKQYVKSTILSISIIVTGILIPVIYHTKKYENRVKK